MFNIALCNMRDYELNSDKSSIPYSKIIYQYKFWKNMKEYVVIKNKYLQTITRLKTVPIHHRVLYKNHLRYVLTISHILVFLLSLHILQGILLYFFLD